MEKGLWEVANVISLFFPQPGLKAKPFLSSSYFIFWVVVLKQPIPKKTNKQITKTTYIYIRLQIAKSELDAVQMPCVCFED